jgi:hypothetical protein
VNKEHDETQPYCNSGQRKAIDDAHTSVVSLMSFGGLCRCAELKCECMMSLFHSISRRHADDKTRTFLSETYTLTPAVEERERLGERLMMKHNHIVTQDNGKQPMTHILLSFL